MFTIIFHSFKKIKIIIKETSGFLYRDQNGLRGQDPWNCDDDDLKKLISLHPLALYPLYFLFNSFCYNFSYFNSIVSGSLYRQVPFMAHIIF
jgi:hypothetical protein